MNKFIFTFHGKLKGALGGTHKIRKFYRAKNVEEAYIKLYKEYQNITKLIQL